MADIWTLSNTRSAVKNSLADYQKDVFSYKLGGSVPNCSVNKVVVSPQTSAQMNSVVRYRLPEWGLLDNLVLRLAVDWGAVPTAPNVADANACDSFTKVELRTHDKVIETLTSHTIHDWISKQNDKDRHRMETANSFTNNYSNQIYTTYCPLPFSQLSNLRCLPDLKHCQNVEVFVYFRPASQYLYDTAASTKTLTNSTQILARYLNPDSASYSKLLASNYKNRTSNHSSIIYDSYQEPVVTHTTTGNNQTIVIDLNCNMPSVETRVMVLDIDNGAQGGTQSATKPRQSSYKTINHMTIKASGKDVLPQTSATELKYVDNQYSIGMKGATTPDVYKFVPTLMPMPKWKLESCPYDNGAISFNYLNNPQLVLNLDVPANGVEIRVEHTVIQSKTVSSQTGAISVNFAS